MTERPVVCDLSAIQSPDFRGRGVGRWSYELAVALERQHPDLVAAYLLDPAWPPPGRVDDLLGTGKLAYVGTPEADAVAGASVHLCCSPFELSRPMTTVRPAWVDRRPMGFATVAYDLIPLRMPEEYLEHPSQRRRYTARLEILRHADSVLAISAAAASDAIELAGVAPDRCHVVGTGVSANFQPSADARAVRAVLASDLPDLARGYVLYPAGNDGRKNIEGCIAAFARYASTPAGSHSGRVLVIVGDLPPLTDNHYRHLAHEAGIGDRVVLTGFVSDERLVQLNQAADLVVFPSLAEGYGIPIAEGLACGAVAAVSDRSPFDDLVPDARARFDPTDPADMAAVIERCLTDEEVRQAVRRDASRTVDRWDAVGRRVATCLDELAARPSRRHVTRRGRRLAVISPLPPTRSGVAGYSAALVEAMVRARPDIQIDCFADGLDRYPAEPDPIAGERVRDARCWRGADGAIGGYDSVLYVLGNSECHATALADLRQRPGVVMAHDVRMSGLMKWSAERAGAVPGGLAATITRTYGGLLPPGLGADGSVSATEQDRYGLLLARDVLGATERLLVSSEAARRLAALDAGPDLAGRIGVVPFALQRLSEAETAFIESVRSTANLPGPPGGPDLVVATFGIVDPSKRPAVLVRAAALVAERCSPRPVRLAIVGPVSDSLRADLEALAGAIFPSNAEIELTGAVSWEEYLEWLARAEVGVQMRDGFFGEASGAVAESLSAGVPTIVSDVGWLGGLPGDAVVKVPRECSPAALAEVLVTLATDDGRRAAVGAAGQALAASATYSEVAEAVLAELGL